VVFVIGRCAFLAFKCLVLLGWIFGPLIYSPILWLYGVRWWIAILLGIALGCLPMVLLRMLARSGERMDAQRAASELIADYVQDRDLNPYEFGTWVLWKRETRSVSLSALQGDHGVLRGVRRTLSRTASSDRFEYFRGRSGRVSLPTLPPTDSPIVGRSRI